MTTSADRPIPILLYHSLTTEASAAYRPYAVDPGRFREQMEQLASDGFRTLTVGELAAALDDPEVGLPERCAVLTFDDGFEEIHRVALPILDRLRLRASVFVVTGYIGRTSAWLGPDGEGSRPLMAWGQVEELAAQGIEIGSHSHGHRQLDTLSRSDAADEVSRSRRMLEDRLGQPIRSFAYPHGYHSRTTQRLVREAGYAVAVGVKDALSHPADDRWGLGRVVVWSDASPDAFTGWLAGQGLPRSWTRERAVTRGWRLVRRVRSSLRPAPPAPDAAPDGAGLPAR